MFHRVIDGIILGNFWNLKQFYSNLILFFSKRYTAKRIVPWSENKLGPVGVAKTS